MFYNIIIEDQFSFNEIIHIIFILGIMPYHLTAPPQNWLLRWITPINDMYQFILSLY